MSRVGQVIERNELRAVGAVCGILTCVHLLAIHQGPAWASPLLVGDHLFDLGIALTGLLYVLAIGRTIGKPLLGLSDDSLSENLAAMGLGLGAVSLTLLGAGLAHLLYRPVVAGAAVLLTYLLRTELGSLIHQSRVATAAWFRGGMPTAPTHGLRLALILVIASFVLISPRITLPPSYNSSAVDVDTVSYHLAAPKIYLQEHTIVPRSDIQLADAPSGGDILNILGLMAGTDTVGRSLDLLLTILLGAAAFALGRRHFGEAGAWLGALLFLTTEWVTPLAATILPDFAAALLLVLGFSDLLAWAYSYSHNPQPNHSRRCTVRRTPRRQPIGRGDDLLLIRAGLLIGLATSFKLTNLPTLPAAAFLASVVPLLPDGWPTIVRLGHSARAVTSLVVAMVIPLLPWLLKNLYFFGAPFYPISLTVADSAPTSATTPTSAGTGAGSHFSHLWWVVSTLSTTYWHYVSPLSPLLLLAPFILRRKQGSLVVVLLLGCGMLSLLFVPLFLPPRYWLGPVVLSDAVLAAIFSELCIALKRDSIRALFGLLLIVDATLWLAAVPVGSTSAVGIVTVGAGEAAIIIVLCILRWRIRPRALLELPIVALLCVSMTIGMFVTQRENAEHQFVAVADGTLSREAYLTQNNWYYPAFAWANRNLPATARIVLVNLVAGYFLDRSYLDDWGGARIAALESVPAMRREELAQWCRDGINYAVFDSNFYLYDPRAYRWTREPGLGARTMFTENGVEVLAITPCTVAHQESSL